MFKKIVKCISYVTVVTFFITFLVLLVAKQCSKVDLCYQAFSVMVLSSFIAVVTYTPND